VGKCNEKVDYLESNKVRQELFYVTKGRLTLKIEIIEEFKKKYQIIYDVYLKMNDEKEEERKGKESEREEEGKETNQKNLNMVHHLAVQLKKNQINLKKKKS
jgi:hypothetical protein